MITKEIVLFRAILNKYCWSKGTAFPCKEERFGTFYLTNSRGQCYVTALLFNTIFGGEILHGHVIHNGKKEHHFWNKKDGEEVDLTSDQYGFDVYEVINIEDKKVYNHPNFNNKRYLKLLEKYNAFNK